MGIFSRPVNSTGDNQQYSTVYFKGKDYEDDLVLFLKVHSKKQVKDAKRGEATAVFVDLVNLIKDTHVENVQILNVGIVKHLEEGQTNCLGVIRKYKTKNGFDAFILEDVKAKDQERAEAKAKAWMEKNGLNTEETPTQDGWAPDPVFTNNQSDVDNAIF